MIFLWFCFLFSIWKLYVICLWFCYLFLFGYYIAVILLPFLIWIFYCCDFATFSYFNTILLWFCYLFSFGYYIFFRKGSKMYNMIWFWLNFWLNPLRVSPLIGGRWVFRFLLFGGPYRGKFLEANSKRHCGPWRVCVGWCSPTGTPLPYPAQVTVERWRVPNSKAS